MALVADEGGVEISAKWNVGKGGDCYFGAPRMRPVLLVTCQMTLSALQAETRKEKENHVIEIKKIFAP